LVEAKKRKKENLSDVGFVKLSVIMKYLGQRLSERAGFVVFV